MKKAAPILRVGRSGANPTLKRSLSEVVRLRSSSVSMTIDSAHGGLSPPSFLPKAEQRAQELASDIGPLDHLKLLPLSSRSVHLRSLKLLHIALW